MSSAGVYLDPSAFLKLILDEPESTVLMRWLEGWPERTSSRLLWLEAVRAIRRYRPDGFENLRRLLSAIELVSVDDDILETAALLQPLTLRSLDAIHLATAMTLGDTLGMLVTYDRRMIDAAQTLGLPVASPA